MQIRLIHTADIHLDARMGAGSMSAGFGNRRRQSLRDVLASIVSRAGEWPADALLIAGDLFEHERIGRDTVAFLRSQFESIAHVPVFIAPGNHDPFVPASPYATETWPENVIIFNSPTWSSHTIKDGSLVVHGFGFDGTDISSNPFGKLNIPNDGSVYINGKNNSDADGFDGPGISSDYVEIDEISSDGVVHVAVAHGTEKSHQPPEKDVYAPFDVTSAVSKYLTYMAMGHFHSMTPLKGPFNTQVYYSGSPEGHSFAETGLRYYLEIEIDERGVHVEPIPSSKIVYESQSIECTDFTSTQQLIEAIRKMANQDTTKVVMRIKLKGSCLPTLKTELLTVHDAVDDLFEYLDLVDNTDEAEDYVHLARSGGSLGAFVTQLNEELRDTPDKERLQIVARAREVGLASYRGHMLDIHGLGGRDQ